jgi:hypothetical protein
MADEQPRRRFLKGLVIGGGVMVAAGSGLFLPWSRRALRRRPGAAPSPAVLAFFGDLRPGTKIGRSTLTAIYDVTAGIIPVLMVGPDGQPFEVHVARRDPEGPRPVAETADLALYLANGGDGKASTVEDHGLGVMALRDQLLRREGEGAAPPTLLTLRERSRRYPGGVPNVLG